MDENVWSKEADLVYEPKGIYRNLRFELLCWFAILLRRLILAHKDDEEEKISKRD